MVAARATVDHHGRRALAHRGAVRRQAGALDIEVERGISDMGEHRASWQDRTTGGLPVVRAVNEAAG